MKLIEILNESKRETKEGGYSRTMTSLRGLNPHIHTIVILTAENPCNEGEPLSPEENNKRNNELENILRQSIYGYRKIKGKYGVSENSFVVNNMSKRMGIKLGGQFNQDTIIFGERTKNGMTFQLIRSSNCYGEVGDVVSERKIFIDRDKQGDFYSEIKGRKFQIPFFDVTDDSGSETKYGKAEWDGGRIVGTYSNPKPEEMSPEDNEKIDELISESLKENRNEKFSWMRRGEVGLILKKYR